MVRWKRWWPDLAEDLPIDVLPASNGEFVPPPPAAEQVEIMRLADAETERWRRKMGMSRRDFVRTSMAYAIGVWAIETVWQRRWAYGHNTATTRACDTEFRYDDERGPNFSLANLPGEFIFDVQSHHVESDGMWRVTNPAFEAFFAGVWSQAGSPLTTGAASRPGIRQNGSLDPSDGNFIVRGGGGGELDPIENLSRYHYLKELFLDSATTMTVLSAVPSSPDLFQPLPIDRAALTVQIVNELAGSQRTVMHAFVMPNRGSAGSTASSANREPLFMQTEFDTMEERTVKYRGFLRGWKTYPAWGDVAYASGWFFDDPIIGERFIAKVSELSGRYGIPANIATHKGFALPGFDQRAASPRDIGPAARMASSLSPPVNFIVYHSGFDGEAMREYPGDEAVSSADRTVNSLIKSLRENGWDATAFGAIPAWQAAGAGVSPRWANVPNVWAEIGSTWRSNMNDPLRAAHLLGKLITFVGPKRICWGTDSLWFGSPHSEIVVMRNTRYDTALGEQAKVWDYYGLPYAIDGDADDPTVDTRDGSNYPDGTAHPERSIRNWIFGRAAAEAYRVDADAHLLDRSQRPIKCDEVQKIRDAYILNQYTPKENAPFSSNQIIGPRTRRELIAERKSKPWGP